MFKLKDNFYKHLATTARGCEKPKNAVANLPGPVDKIFGLFSTYYPNLYEQIARFLVYSQPTILTYMSK